MDSKDLAKYLEGKFRPEGFETTTNGACEDLYIEIAKRGSQKITSGLVQPVTLRVQVDSDSTTVTLGRARWGDKAALQKFGSIVFFPLTFTRSSGIVPDKTPEKIWMAIDQFIVSREAGAVEEIVMEGYGQAVDPRYFGGRIAEIGIFESRLESTLQGHSRHLGVTGEPGIGKSSTLRKFEELAINQGCLSVRRELDTTISSVGDLSNFLLEAFRSECYERLARRAETWDKTKDFFRNRSISISAPLLGSVSLGTPTVSSNSALQESFFKEAMRLWTQLKKAGVPCVVFFLDEGDQLQLVEGGWRFLKSAFTRLSEAGGKFMLVVAGSRDFLKPVLISTSGSARSETAGTISPIERFLQPVSLRAMNLEEIREVLSKALAPVGKHLTDKAIKRI
ncbi:MAG: ATP-binding protein, partial [Thaumarchaeota archaeon]|nr:ATP-binding protein [Nitrososphaerota archaeon]